MSKQDQNALQEDGNQSNQEKDTAKKPPHARAGGQTDSATGLQPGGGGQPQQDEKDS